MYANIVRSFMSDEVAQLLAVNCYCETAADVYWRYRLLIERYEFLEHMPFYNGGDLSSVLVEATVHFNAKVFGNSIFRKELENNN